MATNRKKNFENYAFMSFVRFGLMILELTNKYK